MYKKLKKVSVLKQVSNSQYVIKTCRKADFMSVVLTVQFSRAALDMNIHIAPLPTVGLSFGISRSFFYKAAHH